MLFLVLDMITNIEERCPVGGPWKVFTPTGSNLEGFKGLRGLDRCYTFLHAYIHDFRSVSLKGVRNTLFPQVSPSVLTEAKFVNPMYKSHPPLVK